MGEMLERLREVPILERLGKCGDMVGEMCAKSRPPAMTIPAQWDDEDVYLSETLKELKGLLESSPQFASLAKNNAELREEAMKLGAEIITLRDELRRADARNRDLLKRIEQ